MCHTRARRRSWPAAVPEAPSSIRSSENSVNDLPCGIDKDKTRRARGRYGGVLSFVLPCGTVVNLMPIRSGESLTQLYAMLGEVSFGVDSILSLIPCVGVVFFFSISIFTMSGPA